MGRGAGADPETGTLYRQAGPPEALALPDIRRRRV